MLTFKRFLQIIEEDAALDKMIIDIQSSMSQIDTQINQRTQQLNLQKQQLQRRLVPLMRKKQQENASNKNKASSSVSSGANDRMQATNTTTPMGSSNVTPGSNTIR